MFIRSVKVPSSNGTVHEHIRIVGSVRENGKVKQKVIANLGRRDTLEAVLPLLNGFLKGGEDQHQLAKQLQEEGPLEILDASTWGPTLVARRVKSHIFVAALAFLIERMLERVLKEAGLTLSAQSALEALKTIRTVQFRVGGELRSGVTPGSPRARQVLNALKLTDHRPPPAPADAETVM